MAIVYAKPGESTEKLLQRFKREMAKDNILLQLKERERYRKPSEIRQDRLHELRQKIKKANRQRRKYQ